MKKWQSREAELLKPVFDKFDGMKGRISIQTNAQDYRQLEEDVRTGNLFQYTC